MKVYIKQSIIFFIALCCLLLVSSCDTLQVDDEINVTLKNQTGHTIEEVYIKSFESSDWSVNILPKNLNNGASITIFLNHNEFEEGIYEFRCITTEPSNLYIAEQTLSSLKSHPVIFETSGLVSVTTVSVSPNPAIVPLGGTRQFYAVVGGTNNPPQTVLWAITGGGSGTSISADGILTVSATENASSLTVRATSVYNPNISGTATITISDLPDNYWYVTNTADWIEAINGINAAGNGSTHTIHISNTIGVPPTPANLLGDLTGIKVTLEGTGSLQRNTNGVLINIMTGQTFIVRESVKLLGRSSSTAPIVRINTGGTLTLEGSAQIRDNSGSNADVSAVHINGGTFNMNGGSITNNSIYGSFSGSVGGAGVRLSSGSFNLSGGSITANSFTNTQSSGTKHTGGGGVYISGGTLNMSGGIISINTSRTNNSSGTNRNGGGGVYVTGGQFYLRGGTISGNTATSSLGTSVYHGGGGVYVNGGTFVVQGGTVTSNSTGGLGGGVFVNYGTFTKNVGGTITGATTTDGNTATGGGRAAYNATVSPALWRNETIQENEITPTLWWCD